MNAVLARLNGGELVLLVAVVLLLCVVVARAFRPGARKSGGEEKRLEKDKTKTEFI